ncbi:IS5 family transposase [Streptomyces cinereoruber]|uniref:IS5 family transposase n=1 Tax=Streptomyces cinereoruber TaxID=67260 RepID=UPI003690A052
MTDLVERLVPDELWVLFRRVVPPTVVTRPQGGGRRRTGDREALAALIFVATSGCTWRQLPPVFGPAWPTVYRRFVQWSRDRVWARLYRVILDELGARGELDWSRCAIDSVSLRAAKGPLTGLNPTDRGKLGSKVHLITDRNGLPLSLGISGANMHDSLGLEPLVRGIPPIRSQPKDQRANRKRRGSKGGRPTGFDSETYKRRNEVERTINRLKNSRAVATRYDKRAYAFHGTVTAAAVRLWLQS